MGNSGFGAVSAVFFWATLVCAALACGFDGPRVFFIQFAVGSGMCIGLCSTIAAVAWIVSKFGVIP